MHQLDIQHLSYRMGAVVCCLGELAIKSWAVVDWEAMSSREDLILARMKQLNVHRECESQAVVNLQNSPLVNQQYFDLQKGLRPESQQLKVWDLVVIVEKLYHQIE